MTTVYLSLGTNMGDREAYLQAALEALSKIVDTTLEAVSAIYETPAWGNTRQADFLNLCCRLKTDLSAATLLRHCQKIELDLDRVRHEHWGPRTIDIDILLYGQEKIDTPTLTVPHPYMLERAFVLVPLADVAKELPFGWEIADLLENIDTAPIQKYLL